MSKKNGQLAIAVPLFRVHHQEELGKLQAYTLLLTSEKPVAYAIDMDEFGIHLMNAKFVETNLEFLGDL